MTVAEFIEEKTLNRLIKDSARIGNLPENPFIVQATQIRIGEKKCFSCKAEDAWLADLEVKNTRYCMGENHKYFYRLECHGGVVVGWFPKASHGSFLGLIESDRNPEKCLSVGKLRHHKTFSV